MTSKANVDSVQGICDRVADALQKTQHGVHGFDGVCSELKITSYQLKVASGHEELTKNRWFLHRMPFAPVRVVLKKDRK